MNKNKFKIKMIAVSISMLMVFLNTSMMSFAATNGSTVSKSSSSSLLQNNLLNNLKSYNKGNVRVDVNNRNNGELFISGILSDKKTPSVKEALKFLDQNKAILGLGDVNSNFKNAKVTVDSAGYTHIRLNQFISGSQVEGRQLSVHFNKEGIITSVSGNAIPGSLSSVTSLAKSSNKKITSSEAISIAKAQFNIRNSVTFKASPELSLATKGLERLFKNPAYVLSSEPTVKQIALFIDSKVYEVYLVNIKYTTPTIGNWNVYVETSSGKVIDKQSNIRNDAAVKGTGIGVDGKTKTLNLDLIDGTSYYMIDLTKPMINSNNITTLTADHSDGSYLYYYYNANGIFTTEYEKAIVDAHYNAGAVYDFYKNLFKRNSIDGNGTTIYSVAHLGNNYNNAFWDGFAMWYGDGDGSTFTYLSGDLDVVGHEMTHGVTQANGDLYYHNQSGALNESMSDVFGVLIETYNKYNVKNAGTWKFNSADWVVGDDVYTPNIPGDALRSLAKPTLYDQPDNMDHYNNLPDDENNDNGGVHTNSGITNKAAYLIAQSIGMQKTAKIYYDAYNYFNYTTDFKGAANAIIQAATDLYGASSAEVVSVKTAFITVKVIPTPTVLVSFNSQGGSAVKSKNANYNTTITAPVAPSRAGYTFGGWYKEAKCINAWNFSTNKVITNTTLYAKWTVSAPATPTSVKAVSSSYNSINVSWNAVTGASKYEVYRATSSKGSYTLVSTTTARNYNNTGLTTNSNYYYKVRAYKLVGTAKIFSGFSTTVSARPVPGAPTNVKATRTSSKSIKITWSAASGASGYEVFRATSSSGSYSIASRITSLYYTNSGLVTGRTYYYKIRSYRNVGKIRVYGNYWSAIVHAKP